jgi:hypothetical protein
VIVESYEDVIVLSGALRSNFWDTIHTAISLLLKRHASGVIIDCAGITECTRGGADTFIDIMNFIEDHDARVIVARVPNHVLDVLKSVPGVRSQLPIAATVEDARKSLDLLAVDEGHKRKKKSAQAVEGRIALYLSGGQRDVSGAKAAIRLAELMHAEVLLAYVILVPRELPEQAPLPQKEAAALQAFDVIEPLFEHEGIPVQRILERGRELGTVLDQLMEEREAHTLVVSLSNSPADVDNELKLVRSILQKVEQSVMLVRPPF